MNELKPHDFDPETNFCRYCGVPLYAVVEGIVIVGCGTRSHIESPEQQSEGKS